MAQQTKHPSTQALRKWRKLVTEWRESGLTAREFCETKGLKSYKTLHVWSSKLNKIDGVAEAGTEIVRPKFLPLEIVDSAKNDVVESATIDVILAGGDMVSIPRGCDMQQVAQVVAILRKEWQ
jgi:hypothetical protein